MEEEEASVCIEETALQSAHVAFQSLRMWLAPKQNVGCKGFHCRNRNMTIYKIRISILNIITKNTINSVLPYAWFCIRVWPLSPFLTQKLKKN